MGTAFKGSVTGAWGHSRRSFLLVALLCFCIRRSTALITLKAVPESPVLGGTVLLTFSFQNQMNIVNWYKATGNDLGQSNVILTYSPSSKNITDGAKRTGRETVFENGSLEIRNLQTTDNGYYTVQITPADSYNEQDTINLLISDSSPRSPTDAIVGAIVGVLVAVVVFAAAILLFKRHQNRRRTEREHSTTNIAQKDLNHNQRQSTNLDQHNDPTKNQRPSPAYETVIPSPSQTLQDQEEDHIYMDLVYADRTVYNHLQK